MKPPASNPPPSRHEIARAAGRIEIVISYVLRVGVIVSLTVVVVGLVLIFARHPQDVSSPAALERLIKPAPGAPAPFPHTVADVCVGALRLHGEAVVGVGLLLLILTPVIRVAVSILAFIYQRDRAFVLITTTVLIVLLLSFALGRAG